MKLLYLQLCAVMCIDFWRKTGIWNLDKSGVLLRLQDLIRQTEIRYGTLNRGVLVRAFRRTNVTMYRSAWRQMSRFRPSVFTSTNDQGIERLRTPGQRYAFIIPHPIGDYVVAREPCDLIAVGRFLEHRGYALALPRDVDRGAASKSSSQFITVDRTTLNAALRTLTDTGFIDGLYRKWWTGNSHCAPSSAGSTSGNGNGVVGPKRQASVIAIYGDGGSVIRNRAVDWHDTYNGDEIWSDENNTPDDRYIAAKSAMASIGGRLRSVKSVSVFFAVLTAPTLFTRLCGALDWWLHQACRLMHEMSSCGIV